MWLPPGTTSKSKASCEIHSSATTASATTGSSTILHPL
ncbi:unnamed protein product [Cyprideis torosa]|uniref:Uncharacterized protein n=1 Tax=Cyprideis torosa TaxID=163714 RepID=A0A7R8WRS1_9CRUS|nr:unnamed protein product [Cyprideis torosa]CAG0904110.1 unnamed protein product [Cyprideis torosa]